MNRHNRQSDDDKMRPEYDFSHGVRGKHYKAYRAGTNVVFLDPDVAKAFADSASVNQALRLLLQLARTNVSLDSQPAKTAPPSDRAPRRAKKPKPVRATRDSAHAANPECPAPGGCKAAPTANSFCRADKSFVPPGFARTPCPVSRIRVPALRNLQSGIRTVLRATIH